MVYCRFYFLNIVVKISELGHMPPTHVFQNIFNEWVSGGASVNHVPQHLVASLIILKLL